MVFEKFPIPSCWQGAVTSVSSLTNDPWKVQNKRGNPVNGGPVISRYRRRIAVHRILQYHFAILCCSKAWNYLHLIFSLFAFDILICPHDCVHVYTHMYSQAHVLIENAQRMA